MYDDILDAAVRVLIDEGFDRASTTRIAERAGISAGSLYQYFANRDAVFAALAERQTVQLADSLDSGLIASVEHGLDYSVGRMIDAIVEVSTGHRALNVILTAELDRMNAPAASGPRTERLSSHVRQLFCHHRAALKEDFDPEETAVFIGCLMEGFAHAASLPAASAVRPAKISKEIKYIMKIYIASLLR